jgi:hypothetical protein
MLRILGKKKEPTDLAATGLSLSWLPTVPRAGELPAPCIAANTLAPDLVVSAELPSQTVFLRVDTAYV